LDAENVIEKHGYKVGVQKLAEACFNDKTENWNFLQIVIAKQEQVINRKKSLY
jgi:pimeloyl-CoA synthetase